MQPGELFDTSTEGVIETENLQYHDELETPKKGTNIIADTTQVGFYVAYSATFAAAIVDLLIIQKVFIEAARTPLVIIFTTTINVLLALASFYAKRRGWIK